MKRDPRTNKEYEALIWAHCRECQGRGRTVPEDCKNDACLFFEVRNRPRQVVVDLKYDYAVIMQRVIEIAMEIAQKHGQFQIFSVRSQYRAKYGNGNSYNWGAIVRRPEWRAHFVCTGEAVSMNERSNGDTVKLWSKNIVLKYHFSEGLKNSTAGSV